MTTILCCNKDRFKKINDNYFLSHDHMLRVAIGTASLRQFQQVSTAYIIAVEKNL